MSQIKFDKNKSKEYKIEAIYNSKVHAKELNNGYYLPSFYDLVLQKGYYKEENI